jgi:cyclophilin family peptidyl-prolyl cis-trans isomerase
MADNSRIHGPGGQDIFEDSAEADTCFAKVVGGFDIVERIHKSPVKKGDYHAMESNIAIVSMTIKENGKQHQ